MKRWALTLVALSGITAGLARADYLILIVNVSQNRLSTPAAGNGGGMLGQVGQAGIQGGAGQLGAAGIQGGAGQIGIMGNRGNQPAPQSIPQLVTLIVEVKANPATINQLNGGQLARVQHKWGTATLIRKSGPLELAAIYVAADKTKHFPEVAKRYEMEAHKIVKDKTTENTLKLAAWALTHGMNKKFEEVMDTLAKDDKDNAKFLNYQKVKAELAKRVDKGPSPSWFDRLAKGYKRDDKGLHYTILHNLPDAELNDITSRSNHLEEHLKGYYYWWAMQGVILPMPKERLVALVAGTPDEFKHFHRGLSGGPIVSDGFHSPRENMVVLALYPQSDKYEMLNKFADQYFKPEATRINALHGKLVPPLSAVKIEASAMALALKSMEDSSERAGISHQGTRQLLYACELLPRNVDVPQWLLCGMGSVFETAAESPWPTLGAPSIVHLPKFRDMLRGGKLEATAFNALKMVVTDGYFRAGPAGAGKADPTAWALCYFLVRKQPAELKAFFKELGRMPRDIELDDDVLLGCFARAFGAWDNNTQTVVVSRLQNLAQNWFNDMKAIELEGDEWAQGVKRAIADEEKKLMPGKPSNSGTSRPGLGY